ncbi:MAG: hypothetical protein WC310_03990 [Patescibacteria group bacterium]|jgi:hypothetical protein
MSKKTQNLFYGIFFACGVIYLGLVIIAWKNGVFDNPIPYRMPLGVAYIAAWAITIVFFLIPNLYQTKKTTIGVVFIVLLAPAILPFTGFLVPFFFLWYKVLPQKNQTTTT